MRIRKTKVVATIGPSSDDPAVLDKMLHAGMDVARLNVSHGTLEEHKARIERLRAASSRTGRNIALMLDTRGLEIRTGKLESGAVVLRAGEFFKLYLDGRAGSREGVSVSHQNLAAEVALGDAILIDDGKIELEVIATRREEIETRIECGGTLRSQKSVNLPGNVLSLERLSERNREDLKFAASHEIDYVAASFVQSSEDVEQIVGFLAECGVQIPIIAKIENSLGVENLEAIVEIAQGVMVARGDLGVEVPMAEVPVIQKKIIRATVSSGKPVVTATQMLDSMERNPRPTRAEVSDVANAILDGSSAVMLSGETAAGRYPVESVEVMAALALEAEMSLDEYGYLQQIAPDPSNVVAEAVSQAAITMSTHLNAAAIVCLTDSGRTARRISKYRPGCPIYAVAESAKVIRRLSMNWGVFPVPFEGPGFDTQKVEAAIRWGTEKGYLRPGDVIVATGSTHGSSAEPDKSTDMIRVIEI